MTFDSFVVIRKQMLAGGGPWFHGGFMGVLLMHVGMLRSLVCTVYISGFNLANKKLRHVLAQCLLGICKFTWRPYRMPCTCMNVDGDGLTSPSLLCMELRFCAFARTLWTSGKIANHYRWLKEKQV